MKDMKDYQKVAAEILKSNKGFENKFFNKVFLEAIIDKKYEKLAVKTLGPERVFRNPFRILAPDRILRDPFCRVDHNSVMHYKSCIDVVGDWDTKPPQYAIADGWFWRKLAKKYPFYPILEVLEINYIHSKSFSSRFQKGEIKICKK